MPVSPVFETTIDRLCILSEDGTFDDTLGAGLIPDQDAVALYRHIMLCRHFDEIAFKLQRSGRMGTYPENRGQEVTSLGAAYALQSTDWLVPCYRENAGLFWRGLPMEKILLHWMGDERGNDIDPDLHITPLAIPIGTQMLHAVGLAWAKKYRGDKSLACTFFGDGATSEGDFHEAMNFAANLDIPTIFFCQNNGWAISVPTHIQCSAPTIAQRALAYGMPTIQVDGNDIFAVVKAVKDAAQRARETCRPSFIEATTYRLGDHTTADDARRYRDEEEVAAWQNRDPLVRLRMYLEQRDLWDESQETAMKREAEKTIVDVVKRAEEIEAPVSTDMFDSMYATTPENLKTQRRTMRTTSLGQDPSQLPSNAPKPANA
ncbi:MAG: pyruvate dehydrogenase (acetyl-transferring) E1 component subunit alpha [Phycisphaerales bacterium]|nr:pyruvate dehydrogenase (acetyl-transferring) E1 component subunit alpha [Phycisphaerales bacterium]